MIILIKELEAPLFIEFNLQFWHNNIVITLFSIIMPKSLSDINVFNMNSDYDYLSLYIPDYRQCKRLMEFLQSSKNRLIFGKLFSDDIKSPDFMPLSSFFTLNNNTCEEKPPFSVNGFGIDKKNIIQAPMEKGTLPFNLFALYAFITFNIHEDRKDKSNHSTESFKHNENQIFVIEDGKKISNSNNAVFVDNYGTLQFSPKQITNMKKHVNDFLHIYEIIQGSLYDLQLSWDTFNINKPLDKYNINEIIFYEDKSKDNTVRKYDDAGNLISMELSNSNANDYLKQMNSYNKYIRKSTKF